MQLYGLKGLLGNCGGAGQCSSCFISLEGGKKNSLSPLTFVEKRNLKINLQIGDSPVKL